MFQKQFSGDGFEWIDHGDHQNCVLTYIRKGVHEKDNLIIVLNLTPEPRENYRIGIPKEGELKEVFNSDLPKYNGTGNFKNRNNTSESKEWNNRKFSTELNLPPLAMLAFKYK
jgi:1,4-alpha-glucan branching enzyme